MYSLFVFVILALAFRLAWEVVTEVLDIDIPKRFAALIAVVAAVGVTALLDYSVFSAFSTHISNETVDRIATGVALVAGAVAFDRVTGIFHTK